jgi:hypothetical protein
MIVSIAAELEQAGRSGLSRRSHPQIRGKNRRGIGEYQSKWTAEKMDTPGSRGRAARAAPASAHAPCRRAAARAAHAAPRAGGATRPASGAPPRRRRGRTSSACCPSYCARAAAPSRRAGRWARAGRRGRRRVPAGAPARPAPGVSAPLFHDKNTQQHIGRSQSKRPQKMWKRPLTLLHHEVQGGGAVLAPAVVGLGASSREQRQPVQAFFMLNIL